MKAQAGLAEQGITESTSRAKLNAAITLSYSIDNELNKLLSATLLQSDRQYSRYGP